MRWLRLAGIEVQDFSERLCWYGGPEDIERYTCVPWESEIPPYYEDVSSDPHHVALAEEAGKGPRQWYFSDHDGHFAGSSDGKLRGAVLNKLYGVEGWGGFECKTHSVKSFQSVKQSGVLSSKPVHYAQMQIYMRYFGLAWTLYTAVNKNDDEIYYEVVHYKPEVAEMYITRAAVVIGLSTKPNRITEDPSWFECKFCDFREICFRDKAPHRNCRTCAYSLPTQGGEWGCNKFTAIIPKDFSRTGCESWETVE